MSCWVPEGEGELPEDWKEQQKGHLLEEAYREAGSPREARAMGEKVVEQVKKIRGQKDPRRKEER